MPKKDKKDNKPAKKDKAPNKKQMAEKELLNRANDRLLKENAETLFRSAYEAREKYDWEWLTRDLFRRGYQFSTYDSNTKTVMLSSRRGVRIPINLLWAQMRSVKNQVTNFKPKWEVLASGKSDESITNAKFSGKLLDYYYGRLKLRSVLKKTVMQGLMFSVGGPWQIGYDEDADNGNGEVYVWLLDPYDFYIDPYATKMEDAQYCVKAVRKNLNEIKTNPRYTLFDDFPTGGESALAASPSKQFLLQALKSKAGQSHEEEEEGAILKEAWIKTRVSEENMDDLAEELKKNGEDVKDLKVGEVLMRIVHFIQSVSDPLLVQLKRRSDFPFVVYHADINPSEFYGESWAKHIIPINRVLNALEGSVFSYNYRYAIGRIVIDKSSGVRLISNQHGDFIEKNHGSEVSSLPLQPLPSSYQVQIDNCRRYIEDLGGAHEVSQGRLPTSITSGIAIAELKQADACVDIETEALTKRGWKKYNELLEGEDIYTLDPKSQKGRWGKLNKVFYYDKENVDVYEMESRNISCLATNDHSWLVENNHRGWESKKTDDLVNNDYIPLALESSSIPEEAVFSDDFVELAGWVITEGTYSVGPVMAKRGSREIRIYQMAFNKEECDRIRGIFKRLGIKRKPFIDQRGCCHFSFAKGQAKRLRELFPDKTLTMDFVNKLTKKQLELLLNVMIMADGSTRPSGRRCFVNTKEETIDSLQVVCSLLGINTNICVYDDGDENHALKYVLYLKRTNRVHIGSMKLKKTFKKVKFTGRVWCPNTDVGYWLARRDGKVFYTGNTNQSDLVDSLEEFLVEAGNKILKEIADNYEVPKVIKDLGLGGDIEHFAVIGDKGAKTRKNKRQVKVGVDVLDLAVIGSDNEIRVTVGSWLAYTKSARQEKIKELYNSGLIDQKTALQHLEFSDVDSIIESTRKSEILKQFRSGGAQGADVSDEEIARQENNAMIQEGTEVEALITDNHTVHNIVHQEALGLSGNEIVEKHMDMHIELSKKKPKEEPATLNAEMELSPENIPTPGAIEPQGQPLPQEPIMPEQPLPPIGEPEGVS